ncbi:MAG TPA: ABC transporter permease [Solirubrobacteraceae bacterium]|jgi:putative ABC transport system permease protein|nr:ABC transporter permease [Solirubrobacteraceae bacterium]
MLALLLRGFMQRKLRVILTAIAVALGVALMAGTYILTDTINNSFAGIFQTANKGHDVVITPAQRLGSRVRAEVSPIDDATLARVRAVPGVAIASGSIFSPATLLDAHGKRLSTGSAPAFVSDVVPKRFESFSPVSGRFPAGEGEAAIDQATADRKGLELGQQLVVAGSALAHRYTIVGIVKFAGGQSFGGASTVILTAAQAQLITGEPGHYDQIDVAAAAAVTPNDLRARVRAALPASVEVRTGAQEAAKETSDLEENLSFLRTFLLVFAYVALFVGAFIIFNTFSITVAQRTREFGLLRTLGAGRGQLLRMVFYEGLLLGVAGSLLGLLGGIALAPALDQLFKAIGADLPDSGTVLQTRTIVVSLLVGVVVTLLAGLAPAIRATRVPPIAALREGVEIPRREPSRLLRLLEALVLVLASLRFLIVAAQGKVEVFAAIVVAILAYRQWARRRPPERRYRVVPALARAVGVLVVWRGITGRLARENAMRQPGRTMVTAAALTIGLALVTFVAVLADGTKATIDQAISSTFAGDLIIENSQAGGRETGIPALVAPTVQRVPGVAQVTAVAFTVGRPVGSKENATVTAVEPTSFIRVYKVEWKHGSNATLLALGSTGVLAAEGYAKAHHLSVGKTIVVLTPSERRVRLTITGIVKDRARLLGNLTISRALARAQFGQREDAFDFVAYAPGASNATVQPAIDRLLASAFPQTKSRTAAQFKQEQSEQINTLLTLIYVLLALSVIVSLFGIVNTLVLSIYERTRELGMMRAIGTQRRQLRQMIRYESVITALIGGVLGLAIGVVGAVLTVTFALSGSGFVQSIPVGTLFVLLLVAALAGVIAAQLPARRAAKLDLLEALVSE